MTPRLASDLARLAHVEAQRGDPCVASYATRISVGEAKAKAADTQIEALQSITSDPTLGPILSDPGKLLVETLKSAAESAAGVGLDTLKSTATAFAPNIADALGMSVADLADAMPFVGQAIAVVFKIVDGLSGATAFNEAQETATCSMMMDSFRPVGTGSVIGEGAVVPADLFAPVHRIADTYSGDWLKWWNDASASQYSGIGIDVEHKGNPMTSGPVLGCPRYASTLGQAMMLLTEGAQVDVEDVDFRWLKIVVTKYDWKPRPYVRLFSGGIAAITSGNEDPDSVKPYPTDAAAWSKMAEDTIAITDSPWELVRGKGLAIDPIRRNQLRKIRRAIAASYKPGAYGGKSDGGAAMWIVYLDILRDLFKRGSLSPEYVAATLVFRQYAYLSMIQPFGAAIFGWNAKYLDPKQAGLHTCAAMATDQILGTVRQWDNAAAPRYAQGQAKIDAAKQQARGIGERAAERASGEGSIVRSIADGIRNLLGGA